MQKRTAVTTKQAMAEPEDTLDSLRAIERYHQRLWFLALLLLMLVSISLFTLEATSSAAERFISGVTSTARAVIDEYGTAVALLVIVLAACAYFYEKLLFVRNQNRELVQALESNARALALRNHQLDTWDRLSHQLITQFNLPRLLQLIVATAAEVTESECAAVVVAEQDSPHLRLAAIHGRGMQTELARHVAAKVIATGESIAFGMGSAPEEFDRPDLAAEDLVALAATPLAAATTGGSLLVGRLNPGEPYRENIVSLLNSFASQASIALEKAHLYAENQRQLQRLGSLLEELREAHYRLGGRLQMAAGERGTGDLAPDGSEQETVAGPR